MHEHRSTQARVSNEAEDSNFDAGTALENLRAEVVDIEALARAAEAAAEALPAPRTDRQRVSGRALLELDLADLGALLVLVLGELVHVGR
jgi:hypothetical protein